MNAFGTSFFRQLKAKFLSAGAALVVACQQQTDVAQHPAKDTKIIRQDTMQQVNAPFHASNKVIFDIPALLPLTIAQIKAKLGKPVDELQADYMNAERGLVYKKKIICG